MSPLVAYHVTNPKCRKSIARDGLIPAQPSPGRPYGVYVFRGDGEFNHVGWNSWCEWAWWDGADCWEAAYIGPVATDQYVLNALIFLGPVTHVTLVTGNHAN